MGTAMLCRNNRKSYPFALMLLTPMLDDRDCTSSSKQFARDGPWCGTTNRMAWDHVLGADRGTDAVSELVAPARATDLRGLPQTFIDAGACEVFRDEAVAVALTLWRSGVNAELHVWPGAYHGFDMLSQEAPVAVFATETKRAWLKRVIEAREKELGDAAVKTVG
jgi:acetyl esterase/lipase